MSDGTISRRRVLQSLGAAGVTAIVATHPTGARGRAPLDRYIVGVEPNRAAIARRAADEVYRVLDFGSIGHAVSGWFAEEALQGLRNNPYVRYIEPEGELEAIDHTTDDANGDPTKEQVLPWGIARVNADLAHHEEETGAGSSIAIIDTGIDPNHESLAVAGGRNFVDCDSDADDAACVDEWDDRNGHGTHCAGTANAIDNDIGVVGVSTAADVYAVRVLDANGSGTFSDVAAGIIWTVEEGITVASLSLGGSHSEAVEDACAYAEETGTLVVAAAGNDGHHPVFSTVSYPAAYDEVIAVSAIDANDDIASFSSRGNEIELAAPGVDVLSTLPDDRYDEWSGTSMACPHVAGAAAHLMANGYDHQGARERLNETAEDIGLALREQGNGLVDVAAALGIEPVDEENGADEEEDEDDDDGDTGEPEPSLVVETLTATDVSDSEATLNGELIELEGYDTATVYFEWGMRDDDLDNSTAEQPLESPGAFAAHLTGLESDTDYEFRAVAEAEADTATGEPSVFTTNTADGDGGTTAPTIERFELEDRSNPRWARVRVDWAVADDDGALESVETVLEHDGTAKDTATSSVSGSAADGEHDLRERDGHGGTYDVILTVTDTHGNETSETKQIDL